MDAVSTERIIALLQQKLTSWMKDRETYGDEDRMVVKDLDRLVACKDFAEALIGKPVNLQMDGKVTVGF